MKTFVLILFISNQHMIVPGYVTKADCEAAGNIAVKQDFTNNAYFRCFPGPPAPAQR